jgi:hypothetical protein
MSDKDTYALSYRNRGGEYFYIQTCPNPARNWRGPYPTEAMMQRAMRDELGEGVVARRRAHQVRGHWRRDWRHEGQRIWIKEHQRGDASLGFVTHDYHVEHRDGTPAS